MKNIENKKLPQMLSFNMCKGPKKIWHHFGLFLSLFLAFHLKFLQLCKKPPSYISGTHQLLFPLVNNGQNWCQKLCKIFPPLLILQGECDLCCMLAWLFIRWGPPLMICPTLNAEIWIIINPESCALSVVLSEIRTSPSCLMWGSSKCQNWAHFVIFNAF